MYDNVCKFLAENFSADLASWLVGRPIALTQLSPTELNVEPIRADSLILLDSPELLLHGEFQVKPDATIPARMANYRLRIYHRFPTKPVRQVVIYLRPTRSPLVYETSASSQFNFRVNRSQFTSSIVNLHLPINSALNAVNVS
jgi:predicted transposase/invertase (TIGR01784 family)